LVYLTNVDIVIELQLDK